MPVASPLQYRVFVSGLLPVSDSPLPDGTPARWSPLSHTLVYGPTEAAVVDPPITVAQATALANWIEAFGKRLSHVYITHWHADHWLATGELARRFRGLTVHASAATIDRMVASTPGGVPGGRWAEWFPGQLPPTPIPILAEPVPAAGFTVDGHHVLAVEAGHSDTDDTTVLHVPSIGLVAAGDVVYNNVHQYLAETPGGGLEAWHRALDVVEALRPENVVAGHKDPARPDSPADLDETRGYLDHAAALLATRPTRSEFYSRMLEQYPERINPYTVWLSAGRLLEDG
ncbi:MBL fold metallo-hydrolase [Amycolatopsis sp. NPDC051903]|uniref:MBL fold metallo-hydrolase n=1 Tax=Amycolatopsis sp. NPDC051903 TaxID=3363936 RepID=UPI0037B3EA63